MVRAPSRWTRKDPPVPYTTLFRSKQHDWNRDRRDNRGAPVLQKQEHHEEDEHDRLDQGVHHLFYREAYERGGVVWKGNLDVGGEALGDRLHFGLDRKSTRLNSSH